MSEDPKIQKMSKLQTRQMAISTCSMHPEIKISNMTKEKKQQQYD